MRHNLLNKSPALLTEHSNDTDHWHGRTPSFDTWITITLMHTMRSLIRIRDPNAPDATEAPGFEFGSKRRSALDRHRNHNVESNALRWTHGHVFATPMCIRLRHDI